MIRSLPLRRAAAVAATAAVALGAAAGPAGADTGMSSNVAAGALQYTVAPATSGDFDVALAADSATRTDTMQLDAFQLEDFRGTGGGWTVTASASDLTATVNGRTETIDNGQISIAGTAVSDASSDASSGAPASIAVTSGALGSARTLLDADTDEGMGRYGVSASTLTLTVPANTFSAAAYSGTITVTLAAGS